MTSVRAQPRKAGDSRRKTTGSCSRRSSSGEPLPEARHVLVDTGQHYDPLLSQVFFDQLGLRTPDHSLGVGSGTHAEQTARVMERLEPILVAEAPDLGAGPGDVNSTLGATLTAVKLRIPVAHVESGLRSFDRTMPEEINRIVTDRISDLLFVHSEDAIDNLRREGVSDDRIHFVGNTMIDTLVAMEPRFRARGTAGEVGVEPGEFLLVTLHRPALVDSDLLGPAIDALGAVARELPVVFPVHPRTRRALDGRRLAPGIRLSQPLGYFDFLSLACDAGAVLTDSGGVQEETTYLRVPCFTLRAATERPVTISHGSNVAARTRSGAHPRASGAPHLGPADARGAAAAVGRPSGRARGRRARGRATQELAVR